jgi:hypothetical protein
VAVRVGKGGPEKLEAALQTAVDGGLLNADWPPTSETLHAFMRETGLGVDCSGFVYLALMAADAALTDAGMIGLTSPQTSSITNSDTSRSVAAGGHQSPRPLTCAPATSSRWHPTRTNEVGHIRIITDVRVDRDWVEYDTAESTTRVGHGPQASTWRLPARGRMSTAHLQVRDRDGRWSRESTGRPSSYWRRLAVPAAEGAAPTTNGAPAARSEARDAAVARSVAGDAELSAQLSRCVAARRRREV